MYVCRIIDELTKRSARFVLEQSTTDHCYKVKAVYSFTDEKTARQMYNELTNKRGPRAKKPTAPAKKKTAQKRSAKKANG